MKRLIIIAFTVLCSIALCAAGHAQKRVLLYPSVDQNGDSIMLSGMVSWPALQKPKGIILLPHFTISADREAPSNNGTGDAKHFEDEYILIMPDYIGYGITKDRIHPYLHGALTAQNSIDMLLHAMSVLDSLNANIPLDSIYIVGFSQGGAAAVWILKLLEEHYSDRIHVKQCFAGSGPYDVAVTYDEAVMRNKITLPMIVPMLVLGTSEAYNLNLQPDDFMTPAMQRIYLRYIKDKNTGVIPMFFRTPNHRLSHWMTKAGMDKTTPPASDFYQGLLRSSLVHYPVYADSDSICPTWTPQAPLYIFHSYNDDVVSFRCAEHLHRRYADLPQITWDFGRYGSHLTSLNRFLTSVRKILSENE